MYVRIIIPILWITADCVFLVRGFLQSGTLMQSRTMKLLLFEQKGSNMKPDDTKQLCLFQPRWSYQIWQMGSYTKHTRIFFGKQTDFSKGSSAFLMADISSKKLAWTTSLIAKPDHSTYSRYRQSVWCHHLACKSYKVAVKEQNVILLGSKASSKHRHIWLPYEGSHTDTVEMHIFSSLSYTPQPQFNISTTFNTNFHVR